MDESSGNKDCENNETPSKASSENTNELTSDQIKKMEEQENRPISEFKRNKLISEVKKNWDLFYKRNTTKFFKDRHWTVREFEELSDTGQKTILEVGCGVGNFIFPLMEENPSLFAHVCDFSPRAVDLVKAHPLYDSDRMSAFRCDIVVDNLEDSIPPNSVDIVTLLFVLSAVAPTDFGKAIRNIASVLKPGGLLLFRDYGLHDIAQIRFGPGHKMGDNWYVRQDGTFTYYFSEDFARELFTGAGLIVEQCGYVMQRTVNKKEGIDVPRRFLQGKFRKGTSVNIPE